MDSKTPKRKFIPRKKPAPYKGATVVAVPGSLNFREDAQPVVATVLAYGPKQVEELEITSVKELDQLMEKHAVTWLEVVGHGDGKFIQALQNRFTLHKLALEDVVNEEQSNKFEEYEHNAFLVLNLQYLAQHHLGEPVQPARIAVGVRVFLRAWTDVDGGSGDAGAFAVAPVVVASASTLL